jgi:E3 ubiquitin-protein ligase synoviolin
MASPSLYAAIHFGIVVSIGVKNYIDSKSLYHATSMMVESKTQHFLLCSFAVFSIYLLALHSTGLFIGKLSPMELENVHENGLRFLADVLLVITIFTDEINLRGLVVFFVVFTLKCLHWILGSRIETMDQSVSLNREAIAKILLFNLLLATLNSLLLGATLVSALKRPSVYIFFCFEFFLLLAYSLRCLYVLSIVVLDYKRTLADKTFYIFYGDLVFGLLKVAAYIMCFAWTTQHFRFPLNLLREGVGTMRTLVAKTTTFWEYRKIVKDMENRYPDHVGEEITGDRMCVICHEEMGKAKKLECGHFFHFECLKGWLDRQQACPVCRRAVTPKEKKTEKVYLSTDSGEYEGIPVTTDQPL